MMFLEGTTAVSKMFTTEHITSITTALNTAITNVLGVFVDLLPVMAIIAGVGFGIAFVRGLFNKVRKGR